jgi:hypothetical protein
MMERSCLSPDQLLVAKERPAGDPQRAHLASCARCQASLCNLESFLDDEAVPEGARPDLARPRLTGAIAQMTGTQRKTRLPASWTLGSLALAAVLVLVAVLPGTRDQIPTPSQVLRGNAQETTLDLGTEDIAAGHLALTWTRVPGADRYVLVFFDEGLQEIARVEAGDQIRWASTPPAEGIVFWQAIALRGSETLAVSDPALVQP